MLSGDAEAGRRQAVGMTRTRLVTALALVGAVIGALLFGGTAHADQDGELGRVDLSVNRGW